MLKFLSSTQKKDLKSWIKKLKWKIFFSWKHGPKTWVWIIHSKIGYILNPFTPPHPHCYCCGSGRHLLPRLLQCPSVCSSCLCSPRALSKHSSRNSCFIKANVLLNTPRLKSILFQGPARHCVIWSLDFFFNIISSTPSGLLILQLFCPFCSSSLPSCSGHRTFVLVLLHDTVLPYFHVYDF